MPYDSSGKKISGGMGGSGYAHHNPHKTNPKGSKSNSSGVKLAQNQECRPEPAERDIQPFTDRPRSRVT